MSNLEKEKNVIKQLQKFHTFPCWGNTKTPSAKRGYKDAKLNIDIKTIMSIGYNIGLALAPSELIAIDIDIKPDEGKNGIKTIKDLELELGPLPKTLTQRSCSGGLHLIYTDKGIISPRGKIGNDVDIKYNGYILVEPSSIDGKNYEFIDGIDENGNFMIVDLPEKWVNYLNSNTSSNNNRVKNVHYDYERNVIKGNIYNMYKNCAFIQHCIKNSENLDETSWFYFACLLNTFVDGATLFDSFSQIHPDYDPIKVKNKFNNAKKYNVNCNTIAKCFNGCNTCPYNNKGGNND